MKSQSLQSGPAKGPLIATFAIDWSTAAPRTTGDQRRNPHGRLPKIRAAPGRNPHPPHFQEWSNSWRNRNWAISNRKSGGRNPPPPQRLRPYFSPKLHPILGVPVRRLWK